jgi:hypothetical protein
MDSFWSRLADQFVDQANVGEGAPGHDGVIAAAGSVRVELTRSKSSKYIISPWKLNEI